MKNGDFVEFFYGEIDVAVVCFECSKAGEIVVQQDDPARRMGISGGSVAF